MERCADTRLPPTTLELRGDDARVVEDQHVALAKDGRQVAHAAILEDASSPHKQHARRIARTRRAQGDPLGRQFEIEKVYAHAAPLAQRRGAASPPDAQSDLELLS
ncbi:hypothetical protein GCM10011371_04440 [Novosphingobium marinum]|nr:hypothetical protein GCM10011371_04440 [Novosphingobium marinum]